VIDATDRKILNIIQENARTTNADIARQVDMAPSAIFERIKKLEAAGLIKGYHAELNSRDLGLGLVAFVFVRTDDKTGEASAGERLAQIPEVQEVHHVAGEDCFLVKVRAKDTEALGQLLRERFAGIDAVRSTRTTIVLNTVKESSELPLDRSGG
jgi:Lrp/AsnC family leucine-responsive transcriptional regulator